MTYLILNVFLGTLSRAIWLLIYIGYIYLYIYIYIYIERERERKIEREIAK